MCLITSSESNLQDMLNVSHDKCQINVYTEEKKILHFHVESHSRINYVFKYGDGDIN